ncbi:MAG: DNA polymerase Y family protein [Actinomycetota bacterium]
MGCPWWPVLAAGIDRDQPAVVIQSNRVTVASPGAASLGVAAGMGRREAESRCSSLTILKTDPAREAREFEKVLVALEGFTPFVEVLRPGMCLFPTKSCARFFGGEQTLAELVGKALERTAGQPACFGIGVADGLFAARVAARGGPDGIAGKPVVVPAGESAEFLAPLPVSLIERPDLSNLLVRLGVKTLGDFAGLPSADVLTRFGRDGLDAHRQAGGVDEHRLILREHQPALELSEELDPPAERCDMVVFAGKRLADELALHLEEEALACSKMLIEAVTEDGRTMSRSWRLDEGFSAGTIAERVRWQLAGWLSGSADLPPGSALVRLVLLPEEVQADRGVQLSFWGAHTEPGRRAVRGLARLEGLLEPESVVVAEFKGGRGPAERYQLVPAGSVDLLSRSVVPQCLEEAPWPGAIPAPSPALVFADRAVIRVLDASGVAVRVLDDRLTLQPADLVFDEGRRLRVTGWAGPWPVNERWWDTSVHRRLSRLQVVCWDGSAHLLAFEQDRWWLEASYD